MTHEIKYWQGYPVFDEPNEPANCLSAADAINRSLCMSPQHVNDLVAHRLCVMCSVITFDDDNSCIPIGVVGEHEGYRWRATLAKNPQLENILVGDVIRICWRCHYEVEPRG